MNKSQEVRDLNPRDVPIQETHFWKWLADNNYNNYRIQAIMDYLKDSMWYTLGLDTVDDDVIDILSAIYGHFTSTVMHPIWDAERTHK